MNKNKNIFVPKYNILKNIPIDFFIKQNSYKILQSWNVKINIKNYLLELDMFLSDRGWKFNTDNGIFYKKDPEKIYQNFQKLSKHKKKLSTINISKIIDSFFKEKDINKTDPLPIITNDVETMFVISGIQNIYSHIENSHKNILVQQPSIRLNGDRKGDFFVSGEKGIATSFVNPTIYNTNGNIKIFLENLDSFFDFLSTIGLFIGDISLKIQISEDQWNNIPLIKTTIHIYYGNMHIGDTSILDNKEKDDQNNILDLGFGLERISFVRNKMDNYFHQYIENNNINVNRYSDIEIDAIKTVCLVNSVETSNFSKYKGPIARYKKIIKRLSKEKNYYPLIKIFYEFWSNFTKFSKSEIDLLKIILNDIEEYT